MHYFAKNGTAISSKELTHLETARLNTLKEESYFKKGAAILLRGKRGLSPAMTESKNKTEGSTVELLKLASEIVSAYVSNNSLATGDLPAMIRTVHNTLLGIESGVETNGHDLTPAVPVKKSVTAEYIVCLEDGKKLKMLKRYLRSQYGMTPEEYRARWGLPADYPMVAPNYAAQRSRLAKQIGLGRTAASTQRTKRKK